MKSLYKNEQAGRSMVEMLGVLAIIGILSVGGIAGYSKAMAKFKISKALDQVSMLVTNIRTLYSGQINFAGLDDATAINSGAASADMIDAAGTAMVNPFNGAVTVAAGTGANVDTFTVSYAGLDRAACVTIATADWGSSIASGLVGITVGTGGQHTWASGTLPVPVATAATECADAESNTIIWEYR